MQKGYHMGSSVVLVDDDTFILKIAKNILEKNEIDAVALGSGQELLEYLKIGTPELILLDIMMPEMDGFETLKNLREWERSSGREEIPVVFLTSEEDMESEMRGFEMGISDYIRKPFDPGVLVKRIDNVLKRKEKLQRFYADTMTDRLTGLLNRTAVNNKLFMLCQRRTGYLMMIDLDYFKLLDDIYGIPTGDKVLEAFARLLKRILGEQDVVGRVGGDEFIVFSTSIKNEEGLKEFSDKLNNELIKEASEIIGNNTDIPLGASIGVSYVNGVSNDYTSALKKAEKALKNKKNNGKRGYDLYEEHLSFDDRHTDNGRLWVALVDDDVMNLKVAKRILNNSDIDVTTFTSGEELMSFVRGSMPDLILLDLNMPGMDGFDTIRALQDQGGDVAEIPVVFLTSEDDAETEKEALGLGALDFIRKPFIPEILTIRVKQTAELIRLQKRLSDEVDRKTRENEQLFLNVVSSLAGAIDAKDVYTNGHSSRVAHYSREIARRYGYSTKEQSDIYIMGLLHDVGKIGVPDSVINKPGRLTEAEFEQIKRHPVIGSQILNNIKEMPKLSVGARWHHERYGGGGYPDGLIGEEIPEEARIIAVADAYDAMSSQRSYRSIMPQEKVRSEIENGSGTQFDPKFVEIMLAMIDEDEDYSMREL